LIFITAKFTILPEFADKWPEISAEFSEATRGEEGCMWFEWARNTRNPNEYFVVEAFRDQDAGVAHVQSEHFKKATETLPNYLAETPGVVNMTVDQDDWSVLGEMAVPSRQE